MVAALVAGFALGFSLILAIGAQNAFVLRQGLRQSHVLPVVLTCAISDAILISLGVGGFSAIVEAVPWITPSLTLAGAAFLVIYGALSFRRAFRSTKGLTAAENGNGSLLKAIGTSLALTWLNPHVYLDTVVLLGSISTKYGANNIVFGIGAVIASFTFFFSLGYAARLLAPFFAKPASWRVLDALVGCVMWGIAAKLLFA